MADEYLHLMTSKTANDFALTENGTGEKWPTMNMFQSFRFELSAQSPAFDYEPMQIGMQD